MDLILATARCEVIIKVFTMVYPLSLEDLTFEKMSDHEKKYETQEKVGCGRKKFMLMKQEIDEPIIKNLLSIKCE